jgi:hypothetical protein
MIWTSAHPATGAIPSINLHDGTVVRILPTLVGDTFRLGLPYGFIRPRNAGPPVLRFPSGSPFFKQVWRIYNSQDYRSRDIGHKFIIGKKYLVSAFEEGGQDRVGLIDIGLQLAMKISERFGTGLGETVDPEAFATTDFMVISRTIKETSRYGVGHPLPTYEDSRFEDREEWDLGPVADFVRLNQPDIGWYTGNLKTRDTPHRQVIDLMTGGLATQAVIALRDQALGAVLD